MSRKTSDGGGSFLGGLILLCIIAVLLKYWWVILMIIGIVIVVIIIMSCSHTTTSSPSSTTGSSQSPIPEPSKQQIEKQPLKQAESNPPKHPYYEQKISEMKSKKATILKKKADFHVFLDKTFGNSEVTKSRYGEAVDQACEVAILKMRTLRHAFDAYGITTEPSMDCQKRCNQILDDVDEIISKINPVIDELLDMEQNRLDGISNNVGDKLLELQETTKLYS